MTARALDGPPPAGMARLFRALRHRNFRLYIGGQLVSLIGTWLQSVAQSWLVYRLTDSALLLGLAGFAGQAPVFFLAPLGGALADRTDRRRLLLFTQSASAALAAVLGILTLSGHITIAQIFIVAGLLGTVNALDIPTRQSFVVEMVGRQDLPNAIALNSSAVNAARILGPALAGVLVAVVGEGWCFVLNAASFLAVLTGLVLMRIAPRPANRAPGSPWSEIRAAWRFVCGAPPVRALLLLLGLISLAGMPYTVLMPIFANRILGGGARSLGILLGASGLGALSAALWLAFRSAARGLGRWVALSAGGLGVSLLLFSLSRHIWLSSLVLYFCGLFMMTQMAASNTLLQLLTPDELRGRIMAFYSMMFMGVAPFGALLAGALAQHMGAPMAVAIGGTAALAGGAFFAPAPAPAARRRTQPPGRTRGPPERPTGHARIPRTGQEDVAQVDAENACARTPHSAEGLLPAQSHADGPVPPQVVGSLQTQNARRVRGQSRPVGRGLQAHREVLRAVTVVVDGLLHQVRQRRTLGRLPLDLNEARRTLGDEAVEDRPSQHGAVATMLDLAHHVAAHEPGRHLDAGGLRERLGEEAVAHERGQHDGSRKQNPGVREQRLEFDHGTLLPP
jgi:MFS family permease